MIGARLAPQTIFHKARALHPGDPVAVVAPAGPFDRESFDAGLAIVADRYRVQYDPGIFRRHRYLAGDDERRLAELNHACADPVIRAIFCARGGYGTLRLLQRLESQRAAMAVSMQPTMRQPPTARRVAAPAAAGPTATRQNIMTQPEMGQPTMSKPLIGFSDITALHQWQQRHGFISIHGPVLTQLGRLGRATHERLFCLLESSSPAQPLQGTATFVEGTVEGALIGGNLSVFTRLLGTPFMPNLDGAVLLLEDVGERPYRLDRMWTHLELAGVFSKVSGIALGSFTHCEERDEKSYTSADLLRELAVATGLPCVAGFPIGHGDVNEPVPLGVRVRLDGAAGRLTFLESAVSE